MANKNTAEPTMERERTVTIRLPREKNKGDMFVSVNEKTWLVKRGVDVEVPECVAEVIRHAEDMEAVAEAFDTASQR